MQSANCPDQVCVNQGWISDASVPVVSACPTRSSLRSQGGEPCGRRRRIRGHAASPGCALLTAIALTIFMVEAQIPVPIPIPGVKLGLANIVTVYAVFVLGALGRPVHSGGPGVSGGGVSPGR